MALKEESRNFTPFDYLNRKTVELILKRTIKIRLQCPQNLKQQVLQTQELFSLLQVMKHIVKKHLNRTLTIHLQYQLSLKRWVLQTQDIY